MKKNRILFRADGNLIAGYGHVIRALSLASMLKNKYHIVFIIQKTDTFLKTQIENTCDEIIEVPVSKNLITEAKKLSKKIIQPDDIVVLDGYNFDINYQTEIKKHCFKLVCIDDIYDRHFAADVIINHSEGINKKNYSIEKFSKLYLGSQYAILRKSFLKKNFQPNLTATHTHAMFISMGGTDQHNYTRKALQIAITNNASIKKTDIVIGSFYPHRKELEQIISKNNHLLIKIHSNLSEKEIFSLMKKSTVAICSASTISYEYASVGGLLFVYQTVPNQKNIYSFFIKSKIAYPLYSFNKILTSFKNKKTQNAYFKNRSIYFSGNSTKNLISIFENLEKERDIVIRLANQNDVLTYFKWANDAEVRNNSITTSPIPLNSHKIWFTNKLENKNSRLYIIEKQGTPLGQVRLDGEHNIAEIDYSIAKTYRGKGYGEILLKNAVIEYFKCFPKDKVIAKAKESNSASNRVFEKLGFTKMKACYINGIRYCCYAMSNH